MRGGALLVVVLLGCNSDPAGPGEPAASVRERLETEDTRLLISAPDSAGSITAERRAATGWVAGLVDLRIDTGEIVVSADGSGDIRIEQFGLGLLPIEIPETLIGRAAQLSHVRADLARPVRVDTHWMDDDQATARAQIELVMSWSLTIDGATIPLGMPDLPPVPVELVLTGDGVVVQGELRVRAPGEMWSWADLIKLEDLSLILSAATIHTP